MNLSPSPSFTSSSWLSTLVRGRSGKASTTSSSMASGGGDFAGSSTRKNHLKGVLFRYGPKSAQVAYKTGDFKQQVIFIGGLTDGLLATEYIEPLSVALENEKWSLVQILLSSSYTGYGISSLKEQ